MTPFQRLRALSTILLIFSLAAKGVSSSRMHWKVSTSENIEEPCPPCELLFSKLEKTGRHGKLAQDVRVQERGEPKSGTGFMYFWASATFIHTCDYLRELFGEEPYSLVFMLTERRHVLGACYQYRVVHHSLYMCFTDYFPQLQNCQPSLETRSE